jgi:hypothetical protein
MVKCNEHGSQPCHVHEMPHGECSVHVRAVQDVVQQGEGIVVRINVTTVKVILNHPAVCAAALGWTNPPALALHISCVGLALARCEPTYL